LLFEQSAELSSLLTDETDETTLDIACAS
jgi:hypothetical protein